MRGVYVAFGKGDGIAGARHRRFRIQRRRITMPVIGFLGRSWPESADGDRHGERSSRRRQAGGDAGHAARGEDLARYSFLNHPLGFFVRRHPSVRREPIDEMRKVLAQPGKQIPAVHPGLLRELVERVASERIREIALRDILVRASADPRMSDIALPALLQLLEQTTEPAIDYRAGGGAAEYSPNTPPNRSPSPPPPPGAACPRGRLALMSRPAGPAGWVAGALARRTCFTA
jgi:hypothetical protein